MIAFELLIHRGQLTIVLWGTPLLLWGYLQYRFVGGYRHPRAGDSLVTLLKQSPDLAAELAAQTAEVMPKGRNFH